jgi:hypothetical protein
MRRLGERVLDISCTEQGGKTVMSFRLREGISSTAFWYAYCVY